MLTASNTSKNLQFYYSRKYLKCRSHIALDGVYLTKKKEVSSFTRSRGDPKI